jgi:hypothetical protein
MVNYFEWNAAIVDHFTSGIRRGEAIYLTINDDALGYIGTHYLGLNPTQCRPGFLQAVGEKCTVMEGGKRKVQLAGVKGEFEGKPRCVAFLAAMVLAAHEMEEDLRNQIGETNYLRRFSELLGLSVGNQGRPLGMQAVDDYPEVALWNAWNIWLVRQGWKPTAIAGDGSHKYISYPISQSLIRNGDKVTLSNRFRANFKDGSHDELRMSSWLMRQHFGSGHLEEGFQSPDPDRQSAFIDAAFRLYQSTDWASGANNSQVQSAGAFVVSAGLFRKVSIRGGASYMFLPRKPPQWKAASLQVEIDGEWVGLEPFKEDLFAPIHSTEPFPEDGHSFKVEGDPIVTSMQFPRREFWILSNDPDDEYGPLATWEKYPRLLGRKFWVLARGNLGAPIAMEMVKYRDARLIDWEGVEEVPGGWCEFRGCMILSRAWDCIVPATGTEALFDALAPSAFATISLGGGMRVPGGSGWLEGFPPEASIYGFEKRFKLLVKSSRGEVLGEPNLDQQVPLALEVCERPGEYFLEAYWQGRSVAKRALSIAAWDDLMVSGQTCNIKGAVAGRSTQGAIINQQEPGTS